MSSSLGTRAARGVGVVLSGQAARAVLQVASVVIMSRLLLPADFGLVAIATAIIGFADVFRDFGLSSAAIQAPTLSDEQRTNLFWTNTGLGAACALVACAASPLIGAIFGDPRLTAVVASLSVVFVLNGAQTQFMANLSRSLRFTALAVTSVMAPLAGLLIGVPAALLGADYWALVIQNVSSALLLLVTTGICNRWLPGRPRRDVSLRPFLRFGLASVGSKMLSYVAKNIDTVALGLVAGPHVVGFYSRAYNLVSVPLDQINQPLTRVALPILSRVQSDRRTYQAYAEKSQLVACYVTTVVLAVVAGASGPFVGLLLGDRWAPAAPIVTVLAVAAAFRSMAQVTYWIYLSKGLTGAQLRLYGVTQAFIVAAILVGARGGALGVATGGAVGYLVFWLAGLWHVRRVTDVETLRLFRRSTLALVSVALPAGAVAWAATLIPLPDALRLLLAVVAAVAYVALIFLILKRVREDLMLVARFALRMVARRRPAAA